MAVTTKITYIGNNSTMVYSIPFDYLSKSHVIITIDGNVPEYTWIHAHSIVFNLPPANGAKITIKRETPQDEPWVVWKDGSVMVATELNAQNLQTLFIIQENMSRLIELEKICSGITESLSDQQDLLNFAKYSPVPFGGFYVDDEGILCLTVYGEPTTDTISINDNGELVINGLLPDLGG